MRQITVRYNGTCAKCGAVLIVGEFAMYEKHTGIFCVGCEPKDTEDIREYRQAKADAKADKYEEWAAKRRAAAEAQLNSNPEIRHDWAFITQPGHIPFRDRMNRADDRAYESLKVAEEMEEKADRLRKVRVAGDAEKARQAIRDEHDKVITKGSRVYDYSLGEGEVVQVCKKSYRVKYASGNILARDKSYFRPIQ